MNWKEFGRHNAPHIHAEYGGDEVVVDFDGRVLAGGFQSKKLRLLQEWINARKDELTQAWDCAIRQDDMAKIAPLP